MTELKVDNITNLAGSGKPNLPVAPTVGSNAAISTLNTHSYTSSGTEPSTPKNGALWWDSGNDKVFVYIDSEFKEIALNSSAAAAAPVWGGIRGLFVGGGTNSGRHNAIQYITITTPGNGTDFGDLTGISENGASASNQSRIVHKKGITSGSGWPASYVNDIDYFAPATTGNASDFGNSTYYSGRLAAVGNGTRGIFGGGYGAASTSGTWSQTGPNVVEYVTIANTGNATDFGDLSQGGNGLGSTNDETRGVFLGGYTGSGLNRIDYITMASAGNSTDFGDTIAASCYYTMVGVVSNNTIGCFSGGYHETTSYTKTNVIQKITIQTAANATDFGDMTQAGITGSQCSDGTTGCITTGEGASLDDRIDKITIGTPGNATDFGDLVTANYLSGADGVSGAAS
tara:strand:- start:2299 stop:3498 length:1200 start_codon:yes stop_codon:yes gene_type:complete